MRRRRLMLMVHNRRMTQPYPTSAGLWLCAVTKGGRLPLQGTLTVMLADRLEQAGLVRQTTEGKRGGIVLYPTDLGRQMSVALQLAQSTGQMMPCPWVDFEIPDAP